MQLVKQISIDTPLSAIIADSRENAPRILEGYLMMTGSNFTRLAAQLGVHLVTLSRILNGRFDNPELLQEHRQKIADCLGWPVDALWPENGNEADQ